MSDERDNDGDDERATTTAPMDEREREPSQSLDLERTRAVDRGGRRRACFFLSESANYCGNG